MCGIPPDEFICNGSRKWLASQKIICIYCYNEANSKSYGQKWSNSTWIELYNLADVNRSQFALLT